MPDYKAVRTFAIDRIAAVSLEKQTFTPRQEIGAEVFANSLGVNTGPAARVEIGFDARVAPYVKARVWHTSQEVRENGDGGIVLSMNVCHDWALRSWILSWGPFARVLTPGSLAADVRTDLQAATLNTGRLDMPQRPLRALIIVVVLLLFFAGPSLIGFYTNWLWFGEVGYQQVFRR